MSNSNESNEYVIPVQFRKMENLHIVFWLFKDIAWCLGIPLLGITMIVPTIIISIVISWRTRQFMSELCHNLAITFWISANSFWMVAEFFHIDTQIAYLGITYKHLAMFPFGIGVVILAFYYLLWKPRHKNEAETM
jgi:hypothetical protein